jgi:hypothetical protein
MDDNLPSGWTAGSRPEETVYGAVFSSLHSAPHAKFIFRVPEGRQGGSRAIGACEGSKTLTIFDDVVPSRKTKMIQSLVDMRRCDVVMLALPSLAKVRLSSKRDCSGVA